MGEESGMNYDFDIQISAKSSGNRVAIVVNANDSDTVLIAQMHEKASSESEKNRTQEEKANDLLAPLAIALGRSLGYAADSVEMAYFDMAEDAQIAE